MPDNISPHFADLIFDAALKSFWRKPALRKFLRQCQISDGFLSTWGPEETKRALLDRLFVELRRSEKGQLALLQMARFLAEQDSFPDLQNWENSAQMIADAYKAVGRLRPHLKAREEERQQRQSREETQRRFRQQQAEAIRSQTDLQKLQDRLTELSRSIGTARAGYDFQVWFYDLLDFCELENRRPYVHDGRQIDGSLTLGGTTYLVELKFTKEQADAPDIDTFFKKVTDKADNTMGVMVSMSGYSSVAIKGASGPRTPLLLLDYAHLYQILGGTLLFSDVIERVRRHASQTGEGYLAITDFGGD